MRRVRENKIPKPKTIARHFEEGKYCDFPLETIMSAVNSHAFDYDSVAIPLQLGFWQTFIVNFNAFVYLTKHNSEKELERFRSNPNLYMKEAGIGLRVDFDEISADLFSVFAEKELVDAMQSGGQLSFAMKLDSEEWKQRHPNKYSAGYIGTALFVGMDNLEYAFDKLPAEKIGLPDTTALGMCMLLFCRAMTQT